MKSTGRFGTFFFAAVVGLTAGVGAFFWFRQGDQEKIRKLETNYERMENRCNLAYEELDRVSKAQGTNSSPKTPNVSRELPSVPSNLVLRTDFEALQKDNASLKAEYNEVVQSNALLKAEYDIVLQMNGILQTQKASLGSNTVARLVFDDMQQSNRLLQAKCEAASLSNLALRARCDSLLKANSVQVTMAEENASLHDEVEALTMSNAVLVVACEKAVQQNIELEGKFNQLKENSVDRATYDAAVQSNAVLLANSSAPRMDGVPRDVHSDVLWSNAVLRTANEALRISSVPRAVYETSVQSNTLLKTELTDLAKRHVVQSKRYIRLGDHFVRLMRTHKEAEELLKSYRTRFLRLQQQGKIR